MRGANRQYTLDDVYAQDRQTSQRSQVFNIQSDEIKRELSKSSDCCHNVAQISLQSFQGGFASG